MLACCRDGGWSMQPSALLAGSSPRGPSKHAENVALHLFCEMGFGSARNDEISTMSLHHRECRGLRQEITAPSGSTEGAGRGMEYVADHLGHKNIQNTRIYAQITNPLREQVFRELEPPPKLVRLG
jgi:integrase